jgi:hypothetical protein
MNANSWVLPTEITAVPRLVSGFVSKGLETSIALVSSSKGELVVVLMKLTIAFELNVLEQYLQIKPG